MTDSNAANSQVSLIDFDGEYFFNKRGVFELGLPTQEAEAIYTQLANQNILPDGAAGYVFIDSVLNVKHQRSKFLKYALLKKDPVTLKNIITRLIASLRDFISYNLGGYIYIKIKFTGFYKVEKPVFYGKAKFVPMFATRNSYAHGIKVPVPFSCLIPYDEVIVEEQTGVTLPKKSTAQEVGINERINSELFFYGGDLEDAIRLQMGDDDLSGLTVEPCETYRNGLRMMELPEKMKIGQSESPLKLATRERIISALFWILQNPKRPKLKDQSAIYRHLEKHFENIKGLNESYISEFMATAKIELKSKELDKGYKTTYLKRM